MRLAGKDQSQRSNGESRSEPRSNSHHLSSRPTSWSRHHLQITALEPTLTGVIIHHSKFFPSETQ
ncbi:hypothetical protein, partial [Mesorhizobium sp. BHbdii]